MIRRIIIKIKPKLGIRKIKDKIVIPPNVIKINIAKNNERSPDARGLFLIFSGCFLSFSISFKSLIM
jgi:hypothetical protein